MDSLIIILIIVGIGFYLYQKRQGVVRELEAKEKGYNTSDSSCRKCGYTVSASAKFCPHCGKSDPTKNKVLNTVLWVIAGIFVLSLLSRVGTDAVETGNSTDKPLIEKKY